MNMLKHYLVTLFFMALMGGYLIYNFYAVDLSFSLFTQIGLYLAVAHGMLLAGFVWMFLVKVMSSAFYKEGYAKFNTGMAMLAAFGVAIYLNLQFTFEELVEMDMATIIVAITSVPLGATLGYRVKMGDLESEQK